MKKNFKRIIIFGPQPPPRHGVASVNEAFSCIARKYYDDIYILNTSPLSLKRSLLVRIHRMIPIGLSILKTWRILTNNGNNSIYISISGGFGQIYEIICILAARMLKARILLHHHSFSYLDNSFFITRILIQAAGSKSQHLVLGEKMNLALKLRYPNARNISVLSNAFILPKVLSQQIAPKALSTVGFLSNLSFEKGLNEFLQTAHLAKSKSMNIKFVIAGPIADKVVEKKLKSLLVDLTNVQYIGPVYGEEKAIFFHNIDLFLFPTKYKHEAEPIVILEALSFSRPVVSYDRGCIREIIGESGGVALDSSLLFYEEAVRLIEDWCKEGLNYSNRMDMARKQFVKTKNASDKALNNVLNTI